MQGLGNQGTLPGCAMNLVWQVTTKLVLGDNSKVLEDMVGNPQECEVDPAAHLLHALISKSLGAGQIVQS